MTAVLIVVIGIASIALFFIWANWHTARTHARFQRKDVEEALAEFISPATTYHDAWELFLAWSIDDPQLESIRQQCIRIDQDESPGGRAAAIAQVAALLDELRQLPPLARAHISLPSAE